MNGNDKPQRGTSSPGIGMLAAIAHIWLVLAIPCVTLPGGLESCAMLLLLPLGFVIAIIWLSVTFISRPHLGNRELVLWWSIPLVGFLAFLLAIPDIGLRVRLGISESWLREAVAEVPIGKATRYDSSRVIGLFLVDEIDEHKGVVCFYTTDSFLYRYGIVYIPPGMSPPGGIRRVRHVYGPWYQFEWKF